ncbi:scavenger receptor class F member 1-like [Gracilinanus agilis]|uniref:scavenger receptor class F member 1-like n=1 Tax=Gracilinanus agilis TaxID=191870 RepID=UPI001CFCB7D6|nr:scavenger receptor class F member 1-like [Gracilinanus agilis]
MGPWLLLLLLLWLRGVLGELELDPLGRHVCLDGSSPAKSVCCPGWRQEGRECTTPICEGPDACEEEEVCVKPGLCRCKPGFFGAQCSSRESAGLGPGDWEGFELSAGGDTQYSPDQGARKGGGGSTSSE